MAFDTFDTDSVATAGVTFTNGNLTAQGGAGAALLSSMLAQTVEGKTSGKWYIEFTCVSVSGNVDGVGVTNSWGITPNGSVGGFIGGLGTSSAPGSDNGWGYFTNGNIANKNVAQTAVNHPTWTTSDVIGIAIDLTNGRIWWRKNTGGWAGTSGTPDPATNTSGFDISHLTTNNCRVYPAVNLSGSSAKFTANFGATAFTGGVPSGFNSGWTNTTSGTYFGTFAGTGKASSAVSSPPQNDKAVSKYTATLTGSVSSITVPFAGATISDIKGVIYDDTGTGGLPGALLGVSSNTITSGNYGENTLSFSGVSVTNGSNYWFGLVSDSASTGTINIILCPPQTGGISFNSGTFASPTNPFGASPSTANFRYPIIINVSQSQTISLSGVSATAAVGTLGFTADASPTLSGVSATAAVGTFSAGANSNVTLVGIAATAAAGSLVANSNASIILSGVSATGLAGTFLPTISITITLVGVSATADVGTITPNVSIVIYLPLITIMNDNPIPIFAVMENDPVPMQTIMPSQIAFDSIMNDNPIPMTGQMFSNPVANEGSIS